MSDLLINLPSRTSFLSKPFSERAKKPKKYISFSDPLPEHVVLNSSDILVESFLKKPVDTKRKHTSTNHQSIKAVRRWKSSFTRSDLVSSSSIYLFAGIMSTGSRVAEAEAWPRSHLVLLIQQLPSEEKIWIRLESFTNFGSARHKTFEKHRHLCVICGSSTFPVPKFVSLKATSR